MTLSLESVIVIVLPLMTPPVAAPSQVSISGQAIMVLARGPNSILVSTIVHVPTRRLQPSEPETAPSSASSRYGSLAVSDTPQVPTGEVSLLLIGPAHPERVSARITVPQIKATFFTRNPLRHGCVEYPAAMSRTISTNNPPWGSWERTLRRLPPFSGTLSSTTKWRQSCQRSRRLKRARRSFA